MRKLTANKACLLYTSILLGNATKAQDIVPNHDKSYTSNEVNFCGLFIIITPFIEFLQMCIRDRLKDPRVQQAFLSIIRVDVTNDLSYCTV